MAKKKAVTEREQGSCAGGCLRSLVGLIIFLGVIYVAGHIYFMMKPADEIDDVTIGFADFELMNVNLFPGVHRYTTDGIDGRVSDINTGKLKVSELPERLKNAVKGGYQVTFKEEELNRWLSQRLRISQEGLLSDYVNNAHIWVDLTEGQMNVIIERELINDITHVTSLLLKFTRVERGYSIQPYATQIGQVKAPGGFARLILGPFNEIMEELSEELLPYTNHEIYDIHVEEGQITLDPRTVENRGDE